MPELMRDPVCGMELGLRDAAASVASEGQRFYFCCLRCHAAFLDTPHRFVGWANDPPRPVRAPDGWLTHPGTQRPRTTSPVAGPCHFAS